jgi:lysophospholipase L1-like esterase
MRLYATAAAAILIGLGLGASASAQDQVQDEGARRILVYGDSLTWGWTPVAPITPTVRHPAEDRWTTALEAALGEGYEVIAEGLSGRTTNIDDPTDPKLNGADYLPAALASHEPLDLVVILLGTNDTKAYLDRTPLEIGLGAGELINMVHESPAGSGPTTPRPRSCWSAPRPWARRSTPPPRRPSQEAARRAWSCPASTPGSRSSPASTSSTRAASSRPTEVDGIHFTAETNAALARPSPRRSNASSASEPPEAGTRTAPSPASRSRGGRGAVARLKIASRIRATPYVAKGWPLGRRAASASLSCSTARVSLNQR